MIGQLATADLARLLAAQRAADGVRVDAAMVLGAALTIVGVPAGQRWEGAPEGADRIVIALDGTGTIVVDDWRATVGPGLALGVPARRPIAAIADAGARLELLVVGPPPEPPAVALEPAADTPPEKTVGGEPTL